MQSGKVAPDEDELGMPSCGRKAVLAGLADTPVSQ